VAGPSALKPPSGTPSKKGTSKVAVAPQARPAPQATVKISSASAAAAPAPSLKTAAPVEASESDVSSDPLIGILAIAAAVMAIAAFGMQVWMFL